MSKRPQRIYSMLFKHSSPRVATQMPRRMIEFSLPSTHLQTADFSQNRPATTDRSTDRNLKPSHQSKMHIVSPDEVIVKQRLNRPISPHLSIYSWEIMVCGALHRNTAILLSGSMYVFGLSYLILPLFELPAGSAELVSLFGNLPIVAKMAIKWLYGFALSFHLAHGMRHLIWDTGAMFGNTQVMRTGIAALGIGALAATGLCMI